MRSISAALDTHLQGPLTTITNLTLITRKDGTVMGFTSSDVSILYLGVTYFAADGLSTTAIQQSTGTGIDNLEVMGQISSSRITEADLAAGIYDGAKVEVRIVNRNDLSMGHITILSGYLGEVEITDDQFKAEVRSLSQQLRQAVGDTTSPTCRCRRLGDLQCKVNTAGTTVGGTAITASKTVASVASALRVTFGSDTAATGHYSRGTVRFTSGLNVGLSRDVKIHTLVTGQAQIDLRTAFPYVVSPGDVATLTAGCDRSFTACGSKFGNANNFHGEERLPTNDKVQKIARPAA